MSMKALNCWKLAALAGLGAASAATAQISTTGPFTGPYTEGFETQPQSLFTPCVNNRIFNSTADMCTPGASGCHTTTGWSFMCTIFSHSGTWFYGSAGGFTEITFDSPVGKFGAYMGTNCGTDGGTATFFDANGVQIGSVQNITTAGCTWTWNGWQSSTPIKKVQIRSAAFGGAFLDMDDMEYDRGGGPPPCYANCDGSTTPPVLNVNDFTCFLNRYAANDSYANCDGSTVPPVLNVNDFTCFLNRYAQGCP
jgi:hypothetical protein